MYINGEEVDLDDLDDGEEHDQEEKKKKRNVMVVNGLEIDLGDDEEDVPAANLSNCEEDGTKTPQASSPEVFVPPPTKTIISESILNEEEERQSLVPLTELELPPAAVERDVVHVGRTKEHKVDGRGLGLGTGAHRRAVPLLAVQC